MVPCLTTDIILNQLTLFRTKRTNCKIPLKGLGLFVFDEILESTFDSLDDRLWRDVWFRTYRKLTCLGI